MKISKEPSVRFTGRGKNRRNVNIKAFQELKESNENSCKEWHSHPAARVPQEWSIVQQLQQIIIGDQEMLKNQMAIKALVHCAHFLIRRHNQFWWTCWFNCKLWCRRSEEVPWKSWKECNLHIQNSCCWICRGSWHLSWRMSTEVFSSSIQLQHMADECANVITTEELSIFNRFAA